MGSSGLLFDSMKKGVVELARRKIYFPGAVLAAMLAVGGTASACAQLLEPVAPAQAPNPLTDSTVNPGKMLLFNLESRFAKDVAARGGPGFASWFADDGVLLGNGVAPIVGKVAIEKSSTWSPKDYQLTWTPTDAVMGPSGDIGYTWSFYQGHSKDAGGNPVNTSGRFITIWRKEPDGSWKVALDAGANAPAEAGSCCKLPDAK
jgi:ketosteroid isomerase-like protein